MYLSFLGVAVHICLLISCKLVKLINLLFAALIYKSGCD